MLTTKLNQILNELNRLNLAIEGSLVSSQDGLTMAAALNDETSEELVSAMSAALFSVGTRASEELDRGELRQVITQSKKGYMVLIQTGSDAILAVLAQNNATLSDILPSAQEAAESICAVLNAAGPTPP